MSEGQGRDIAMVGAGGHAKVCIDVLREQEWRIVACLTTDTKGDQTARTCNGVEVIACQDAATWIEERGLAAAFIAVGDNNVRARISGLLDQHEIGQPAAISAHAVVAPSVAVGAGALIMPGVVINADAVIGKGAIINTGACVDHDCAIGAFAHIAPGCALAGGVRIGAGSLCGVGSRFVPGVEIGPGSLVAAGAVVIKNHGADSRLAGVPARPIA